MNDSLSIAVAGNTGARAATAGICAANVTPMNPEGRAHLGHSLQHAGWLLPKGVRELVPFRTTGAGPSLSTSENVTRLGELLRAFPVASIIPAVMDGNPSAGLKLIRSLRCVANRSRPCWTCPRTVTSLLWTTR